MVPSDQIWGFLHEIIGSREVLTGLSRQLPRDAGYEWRVNKQARGPGHVMRASFQALPSWGGAR